MKLNKNSVTSRLYKWFYGVSEYQGLPNNLCPFFWRVVLMYLTFIPYTLFSIPVVVYDSFNKSYENGDRSTGERLGVSFGVYTGIFLLLSLIMGVLGFFIKIEPKSILDFMMVLGWLIIGVLITFGSIEGIKRLISYSKMDEVYFDKKQGIWIEKKAKVNITAEFIKSKYHKYCPKIDWID